MNAPASFTSEAVTCNDLREELQRFLEDSLQGEFKKLRCDIRQDVVIVLSENPMALRESDSQKSGSAKATGRSGAAESSRLKQAVSERKSLGLLPERKSSANNKNSSQDIGDWKFTHKTSTPNGTSNAPPSVSGATAPTVEKPAVMMGSRGSWTHSASFESDDPDAVRAISGLSMDSHQLESSQKPILEKARTAPLSAMKVRISDGSLNSFTSQDTGLRMARDMNSDDSFSANHGTQSDFVIRKLTSNLGHRVSSALTGRTRVTGTDGNRKSGGNRSGSQARPNLLAGGQTGNFGITPMVPHAALSACVEDSSDLGEHMARMHPTGSNRNSSSSLRSLEQRTRSLRSSCQEVVASPIFDFFTGWLIALNAIMIGIQTDTMAKSGSDKMPHALWVGELVFCIFFSLELALRLIAFGYRLFIMPGWTWAVFDCVVVGMQIVEMFIDAVTTSDDGGRNMGFMRLMRILRLVRVLRVVRIIRFLSELRTIVISILGSMRSLGWTLVLLLLGIYIVGIYFTQLVSDHLLSQEGETLNESEQAMKTYYRNLTRTMLSLFQAMSGGLDWDVVCQPLIDNISWLQGIIFSLYISATVLALMNVVTGVFVEEALKSAKKEDTEYMSSYLMQMFQEADKEGTGMLGTEKFMKMCTEAEFINYIRSIEVDPDEAMALFHLLDLDGSNSIEYEEFVRGCLRLRGSAKAIDVLSLLHGVQAISVNLNEYMEDVGECLSGILMKLQQKDGIQSTGDQVEDFSSLQHLQGHLRSNRSSFDALDIRLKVKGQPDHNQPGDVAKEALERLGKLPLEALEGLNRTDDWDVAVKDM